MHVYAPLARKHSSFQQLLGIPRFKFSKASKRRLLASLARALLLLFGTPWWTGHDIAEQIFIEDDHDSMEYRHRPSYIYRHFGCAPDANTSNEQVQGDGYSIFLEYALLLLELETGRKSEPTEGDCDLFTGEFSPFLMLKRRLDEEREEVSIKFCRIGEACLEFDSHLRTISVQNPDIEDKLRIRAVIYKGIFKPLLEVINDDFPIEADGLDLPDWPDILGRPAETVQVPSRPRPTPQTRFSKPAKSTTVGRHRRAGGHGDLITSSLRVVSPARHSTYLKSNLCLFDVDTAYHSQR